MNQCLNPRPVPGRPFPRSGGWWIAVVLLVFPAGCTTVTPRPVETVVVPQESDRILALVGGNWHELMELVDFRARYRTTDPGEIDLLILALDVPGEREFLLRERAARGLALAGDTRAVPSLVRRLEEDPDEDVRKAAAHALGALRALEAVPTLLARVLDTTESHWVTMEAAEALGAIGDVSVIGALERFRATAADFWEETTALDATLRRLRAIREGVSP